MRDPDAETVRELPAFRETLSPVGLVSDQLPLERKVTDFVLKRPTSTCGDLVSPCCSPPAKSTWDRPPAITQAARRRTRSSTHKVRHAGQGAFFPVVKPISSPP